MSKQHAFSVMAGNVKTFLNQKFEEGYEYVNMTVVDQMCIVILKKEEK